jgi:hypothetical protein
MKNKNISDEEYNICINAWKDNNMKTFKDFLEWYNNLDVLPFIEAVEKMKDFYKLKRLYIFKESYNLPKERKDILMIQMLEAIHPDEALMLKELFSGTFYGYGINKQLVIDAFPDIASTVVSS